MNWSKESCKDILCRALRHDPGQWTVSAGPLNYGPFLEKSIGHGVQALLYRELQRTSVWQALSTELRERISGEIRRLIAVELIQRQELVRVLDDLTQNGVVPLLMKGTPLAYTHYPSPHLRPRGDTDLLVQESEREIVGRVLCDLGYQKPNAASGDLISYQFTAGKWDRYGIPHILDIHWKISNRQAFARSLSYGELASQSVAVPALGPNARSLSAVHSLLLACMHRIAHRHAPYYVGDTLRDSSGRLIWLYDIHLLAESMSREQLDRFAQLAAQKKLRSICRAGLTTAQQCFTTRLPTESLEALSVNGPPESSAAYLRGGRLQLLLTELSSLPGWRNNLQLLKEHAFPPADYILDKYQVSSRCWLPALYLHRIVGGVWKLLRGT